MARPIVITEANREILQIICGENECTIFELLMALQSNVVSEVVSQQIHYQNTGELPQ
jgi:hypothetical protein